ncbi:hypothetical protein PR048_011215 [Dryococelus australis]|uniref:Uncharacterized protein n=1 Tax=Dryococelus australis TaxID=614101 RepID=A0ABQ9HKZ1_9NEOP|nr:hypothetical protein PR048_011215 [Dryococelus australis]
MKLSLKSSNQSIIPYHYTQLQTNNAIDIKNCHGQSYYGTSMSGKNNGLQTLVLAENSLAVWVTCAGHSLNLVVQAATKC